MLTDLSEQSRPNPEFKLGNRLAYLLLAVLVGYVAFECISRISDKPAVYDGKHNIESAYNLAVHGHYSNDNRNELQSTMRREPLYPMVLALWMTTVLDVSKVDPDCLLNEEERCSRARELLKWPQTIFLIAMTVIAFVAGSRLSGSKLVGIASACFIGLNPYYLVFIDRHYTDIQAALLLLIHSYALVRAANHGSLRVWLTAGIALGLLTLTKAVFFYWLVLLVPIGLWLTMRRALPRKQAVVFLLSASILPGIWIARNAMSVGQPFVAERGGGVMSIRAEYTMMSWSEYGTAYLYYTPMIRQKAIQVFGEERFEKFDRRNPEGYYRRVKNGGGLVKSQAGNDEGSMRYFALKVLAQNWPKQLALIPLFAYRGVFQIDDSRRFLVQATLPAWIFLFGSVTALLRGHRNYLVFALPVWFSIAFHAVLTHFIPRYSMPLLPIIIICAFWTGWLVLQRLKPRWSRALRRIPIRQRRVSRGVPC